MGYKFVCLLSMCKPVLSFLGISIKAEGIYAELVWAPLAVPCLHMTSDHSLLPLGPSVESRVDAMSQECGGLSWLGLS